MNELWRRLRVLFRRDGFDRELEEEMQFHLEMQAEENREAGMREDEARYAARRRFGNTMRTRETSRDVWVPPSLERIAQDLKYALRMLRKNPGFTTAAVVTLALGIGATTAVFSVVSGVLLRPLPFRNPDRLVMVWEAWEKRGESQVVVSPGNFADWKAQSKSFEDMAAMTGGGPAPIQIAGEPTPFPCVEVTVNFFDMLGVKPVLGRPFLPEEARGRGQKVIILGHGLWQRLGGDRAVLGKSVQMYRELYTVVGVMPQGFTFPNDAEMWFLLPEQRLRPDIRGNHFLRAIGKLRPGVNIGQAQSELNAIAARLRQSYPRENGELGIGCTVIGLHEQIVGDASRALLVLFGAVACVLLIACANVANLLLARAAGRGQEIALRVALGASRWRLIRGLLTESILLACLGGVAGLAGTYWLIRGFVALDPIKLPRVHEIAVDGTVLLFASLAAVLTGMLFGLWPALRTSQPDLNEALKEGARSRAPGFGGRSHARSVLAVAQMALTIVLLTGALLLLRSFVLRVSVPLGFQPDGVLAVQLPWTAHSGIDQLLERIRALPGVQAVGAGTSFPHSRQADTTAGFNIEGRPKAPGEELEAGKLLVTPDYFRAAGMTLRAGRLITRGDVASAPKVAVINATLARRYFPGADPIGKHISWGDGVWWSIAGVVGDVKGFGVAGDPMPAIYMSYQQDLWHNSVYLLVRTAVPPASLAGAVRKEIRAWKPNLMIEIATIEDLLSDSVAVPRFYLMLVAAFAGLALAVAAVGVYGTINYSVARRRHEIGVRMALGAERGDVLHMIMRQGLTLILAGAAIGLAAAWASTRVLESLLFGVRPSDVAAFSSASIVLVTVGLAASYLPARRATRIDPMEALRHE